MLEYLLQRVEEKRATEGLYRLPGKAEAVQVLKRDLEQVLISIIIIWPRNLLYPSYDM